MEPAHDVGPGQLGVGPQRLGQFGKALMETGHVLLQLAEDEKAAVAVLTHAVRILHKHEVERRGGVPSVDPPLLGLVNFLREEQGLADAVGEAERLDVLFPVGPAPAHGRARP